MESLFSFLRYSCGYQHWFWNHSNRTSLCHIQLSELWKWRKWDTKLSHMLGYLWDFFPLFFLGGDFSSSFWTYYFSNCELKVTLKILSSLKMFSFNLGPLCDFQNNPSHYSLQRFALNSSYYVINLIILFHLEIDPPTAQDGSDS